MWGGRNTYCRACEAKTWEQPKNFVLRAWSKTLRLSRFDPTYNGTLTPPPFQARSRPTPNKTVSRLRECTSCSFASAWLNKVTLLSQNLISALWCRPGGAFKNKADFEDWLEKELMAFGGYCHYCEM